MPKVLPEYLETRRQQILDAAAACFSRRGFHQSTMQDICEEAGLSPGAVYRYFHSKEEIIEGMCELGQNQNAETLRIALEQKETLDIFEELIRLFFGELETGVRDMATCALNVELISEAPHNERIRESLQRTNFGVRSAFVELIHNAQLRGEINPDLEAEAVARVMIAVYQGLITQKLVSPDIDIQAYGDVLRALFGGSFWLAAEPSTMKRSSASSPALRH
jgi:AcrR family transcriptional regulator